MATGDREWDMEVSCVGEKLGVAGAQRGERRRGGRCTDEGLIPMGKGLDLT